MELERALLVSKLMSDRNDIVDMIKHLDKDTHLIIKYESKMYMSPTLLILDMELIDMTQEEFRDFLLHKMNTKISQIDDKIKEL